MVRKMSIKAKHEKIDKKLLAHDAKRKLIEAELLALQHVCPHEDVKEWSDGGGYGGPDWSSYYWQCKDCGLRKVT